MSLENKQIETISENVQRILNAKSETINKFYELETKFNHLQNAMLNPNESYHENLEERKAFGDYLRKGITNDIITKSLSTDDPEAGVAVVHDLNKRIIHAVGEKSVMRQLASIETISTNALDLVNEEGSFASGWVGETAERGVTDTPKLQKKTIFVHELFAQPKATQKLMDDTAIDINSWLIERLVDSFTKAENQAFITGDGDRKPFGLLLNNAVKTIDVGKNITAESLLMLINSLPEEYLANASFLMNRVTLSAIQSLQDNTGRFIWQQSLSDNLKQSIFGIPVFCSPYMPDIGNDNLAIAIGDFKTAYKIVDRSQIGIMRDPYTEKPFVKFYAVKRVGGDVIVPAALTFAKFSA